jgi:hypothetical protein
MMICWDSAHPDVWRDYAGKVDAMVIPSCPPDLTKSSVVFPDGQKFQVELPSSHFADQDIHDQAAWLGVPAVHSSGGGVFKSPMPAPKISLLGFLFSRPASWGRMRQAGSALLEAPYQHHTQIINAKGDVVGRVAVDGDGFTIAEVELPDAPHKPDQPQPKMRTPDVAFRVNDVIMPFAVRSTYRKKTKNRS